eukprot:COSAG06_NODE_35034_length_465_cov_1.267760_1_plen_98_part_10
MICTPVVQATPCPDYTSGPQTRSAFSALCLSPAPTPASEPSRTAVANDTARLCSEKLTMAEYMSQFSGATHRRVGNFRSEEALARSNHGLLTARHHCA